MGRQAEKTETIAVIVPVYNAEKYLRRCVDSVLAQTYGSFDILRVDDGSTDSSPAICDSYTRTDPRVRVIHQENRGLSGARNRGIEETDAPLLLFVDADDEILPEMAEVLYELLRRYDADIAECEFREMEAGRQINRRTAGRKVTAYEGTGLLRLFEKNSTYTITQWNKLFRRVIFEELRYPEGKVHEDEWVIHRELASARRLVHTDRQLYCYYRQPDTITKRPLLRNRIHACEALLDRLAFLQSKGEEAAAKKTYANFRWFCDHLRFRAKTFEDREQYIPELLRIERQAIEQYSNYEKRLPIKNRIGSWAASLRTRLDAR